MHGVWSLTWALLALVSSGFRAEASVLPEQHEFRQTYALRSGGRVLIENLYGDVRITGWDRDEVRVEAVKTGPGRLEEARVVVDSTSGQVSIRTQYSGSAEQPANVEYRISVPRTANLENIRLVNGALSLAGLMGRVKASSVNGSIFAEGLQGQADLSTVNGRMDVDFDRLSDDNPISLSTVNGPIDISLPAGAGARVEAHNLSGGIRADLRGAWRALDGHTFRAVIHRGGALVRLRNVNGGISIRSAT